VSSSAIGSVLENVLGSVLQSILRAYLGAYSLTRLGVCLRMYSVYLGAYSECTWVRLECLLGSV
jgi:hypothetical protein